MPAEQAPIPQLPGKQGRTKEPRARPPATAFSPHDLEENGKTKPRTGDKKNREKSRDLWAAYQTRRADLTRSGGEEDPEASAVERTADLCRIFRLFLARTNKRKAVLWRGGRREREGSAGTKWSPECGRYRRRRGRNGEPELTPTTSRAAKTLGVGARGTE